MNRTNSTNRQLYKYKKTILIMSEIPAAPMDRILRNKGAERVSFEAAKHFSEELEYLANSIAEDAINICNYSGRKTINKSDIEFAIKNFKKKYM
ncbi:MAG: NFYB/HAP3 family transcription factor subunit [Candidatus Aenigmarchaeota archaeon]|nr:NFYB/HAP3 family transcription factor subunit [Candidatus Aenigmarchaeota archaeon]